RPSRTIMRIRPLLSVYFPVVVSFAGQQGNAWPQLAFVHHRPSSTVHRPAPISFNNDIEPILTHSGCNQGACHGSQFGKGGFKLSLAGYDPEFDYESITKQAGGRRVTLADPSESLLLRKPSLAMAHVGGLKLSRDSADYLTV